MEAMDFTKNMLFFLQLSVFSSINKLNLEYYSAIGNWIELSFSFCSFFQIHNKRFIYIHWTSSICQTLGCMICNNNFTHSP